MIYTYHALKIDVIPHFISLDQYESRVTIPHTLLSEINTSTLHKDPL